MVGDGGSQHLVSVGLIQLLWGRAGQSRRSVAANILGSVMGTSLTDLAFLGRVRPRKEKVNQKRSFFAQRRMGCSHLYFNLILPYT